MRRLLCMAGASLCLACAIFADDTTLPGERSGSIRVMTKLEFASASSEEAERWAASLDAALVALPRVEAVLRAPPGIDSREAAEAAGFDALLSVEVSSAGPGAVSYIAFLISAGTGAELYRGDFSGTAPSEAELSRTFWLPLAAEVDGADLTPTPHPRETVEAAASVQSRLPASPWYLEPGLYMGQFGDLWIGRSLSRGVALKAGLYQFLVGYALNDSVESAVVSFTLIEPGIGVDVLLLGSPERTSFYLSAAAFVRLTGSAFGIDPIAPFGTTFMFGYERRIGVRLSLFFELGAAFYPFCDGTLAAASRSASDDRGTASITSDDWYLEVPQFRLGARLRL